MSPPNAARFVLPHLKISRWIVNQASRNECAVYDYDYLFMGMLGNTEIAVLDHTFQHSGPNRLPPAVIVQAEKEKGTGRDADAFVA
ncbi:MAG TPA: hypothetical protein VGC14_20600 [Rhizobium sp.]